MCVFLWVCVFVFVGCLWVCGLLWGVSGCVFVSLWVCVCGFVFVGLWVSVCTCKLCVNTHVDVHVGKYSHRITFQNIMYDEQTAITFRKLRASFQ